MIRIRPGVVRQISKVFPGYMETVVEVEGDQATAICYPELTGPIELGDVVLLNTTAKALGLGTGGYHFIMANLNKQQTDDEGPGHIMKIRYTPTQVRCLSVEEEDSPHREKIQAFQGLKGMPVIIGELHSMLPPAAATIKAISSNKARIAYLMTDGAALPIALSHMVRSLRDKGLIDATITAGHAFGGDLEAVNVYTGLIAAKEALHADVTVVSMGPGILGTGTKYGFTGIEVAWIIDAVNALGGTPIAIPRLSFKDERERHRGISHHTLTSLGEITHSRAILAFPEEMDDDKRKAIEESLKATGICHRHEIRWVKGGEKGLMRLVQEGIEVKTMGRGMEEEKEFFLAACASGALAGYLLKEYKHAEA
jgi:hypothetical protein